MSRNRKNFWSAALFLGSGLFLGLQSFRMNLWGRLGPAEGFFPLLIAGVIVGASLFVLIQSLVWSSAGPETRKPLERRSQPGSPSRVLSYSILLLFYGVLLEPAGFMITTPFFLIITLKFVERQSWQKTVWIGLVSIIISYLLFTRFLGVPLPKGLLE